MGAELISLDEIARQYKHAFFNLAIAKACSIPEVHTMMSNVKKRFLVSLKIPWEGKIIIKNKIFLWYVVSNQKNVGLLGLKECIKFEELFPAIILSLEEVFLGKIYSS